MAWVSGQILIELLSRLARIEADLKYLKRASVREEYRDMSAQQEISELKAEVERSTTVVGSTKALIQGLIDQLAQNADNPEEIRAITAQLRVNLDSLAAAVPANTPTPTPPTN